MTSLKELMPTLNTVLAKILKQVNMFDKIHSHNLSTITDPCVSTVSFHGVCVCVLSSILQGSSGHPLRRLGYVSPAPQAIPKDLVIIHSRSSTWGDLFRGSPVPS